MSRQPSPLLLDQCLHTLHTPEAVHASSLVCRAAWCAGAPHGGWLGCVRVEHWLSLGGGRGVDAKPSKGAEHVLQAAGVCKAEAPRHLVICAPARDYCSRIVQSNYVAAIS